MLITQKYDLGQTIGFGAFSEVKIGTDKLSGQKFAIKIIDKAKCKGKEGMIETEVNILKSVKHDNIIRLFEMFEMEGKIYLVMELVTGGELFDEIVSRGKYNEREAAKMTQKILLAVDYLHSNGIVHRDLKPENLLLSEKTKNAKVMISDFGLSKIYNEEIAMKTACGTPGYVAPEVLKRQGYGREVDLWSIGVITYILLSGYPPFYDTNNVELFKKIMAGRYEFDRPWWDLISERAKDFIRHLLVLNPQQRFTAQEALRHPFITSHCGEVIPPVSEMAATHISTSAPTLPSVSATHPVKKQPERGSTSTVGNTTTAPTVVKTRPLGVKNAVDDSGCVTSNETLSNSVPTVAAGLPSEKNGAKKAGGIFGSKGSGGGIAGWFRGTAGKSSNKLTDKV